jgi:hypothetical protein
LSPSANPNRCRAARRTRSIHYLAPNYGGEAELTHLAAFLNFEIDDLLPNADALSLLQFVELNDSAARFS